MNTTMVCVNKRLLTKANVVHCTISAATYIIIIVIIIDIITYRDPNYSGCCSIPRGFNTLSGWNGKALFWSTIHRMWLVVRNIFSSYYYYGKITLTHCQHVQAVSLGNRYNKCIKIFAYVHLNEAFFFS